MTEWERRIQEYEGESLETFSDGMKIAVLSSHAPESIRNGKYRVARPNSSASATPMDVDGVGKGKGKGCFVCGRPGHAAKDCKFKPRARGQSKGKQRAPLTRTVPPSLKVSIATVARKVTSGQTAGNFLQKRKTRKSIEHCDVCDGGGSGRLMD